MPVVARMEIIQSNTITPMRNVNIWDVCNLIVRNNAIMSGTSTTL